MNSAPHVLKVEVRRKTYSLKHGEHQVLQDVSFAVVSGEIICLYGPSGCGKSTLLRIIAGLDSEFEGTIELAGQIVHEPTQAIGMTVQMHVCYDWLTVAQNIAFGLRYLATENSKGWLRSFWGRKFATAEAIEQSQPLADIVGLSTRDLEKYPEELSGGMKQRMAFARALMTRPKVLLLDEPFSSLDCDSRESLQDVVLRVRRELETSFVCVSHDPEEVLYLGDRILVLRGTPSTVEQEVAPPFEGEHTRELRYTSAFVALVARNANLPVFIAYAHGLVLGIVVWCSLGQRLKFFSTLMHELNHLLAAALCLRRPVALHVHESGEGQAQMGGNLLNPLISLAPYCVPLAAIASTPLYLLLRESHVGFAAGLVGFLLATHLVDASMTFRSYQPDIQESGMLFSLTFCLVINVVMSAALTSLVTNAPSEVPAFLLDGCLRCKQIGCEAGYLAIQLAEKVRTAASPLFHTL